MVDDGPAIRLSSEPDASHGDIEGVLDRINAWNVEVTGIRDFHQVAIFLRDDDGAIRGGITGGVWAGWLHVVALWVDEELRGRGLGRRLVEAAEAEALAAGAHSAFLETHSFQAPEPLPPARLRGHRRDRGVPARWVAADHAQATALKVVARLAAGRSIERRWRRDRGSHCFGSMRSRS